MVYNGSIKSPIIRIRFLLTCQHECITLCNTLGEVDVAISLRLDRELEQELSRYAKLQGKSKSEFVRSLISAFIMKKPERITPWELGKDVFGCVGSKRGDLSTNRKQLLKDKLNAKHNRH